MELGWEYLGVSGWIILATEITMNQPKIQEEVHNAQLDNWSSQVQKACLELLPESQPVISNANSYKGIIICGPSVFLS